MTPVLDVRAPGAVPAAASEIPGNASRTTGGQNVTLTLPDGIGGALTLTATDIGGGKIALDVKVAAGTLALTPAVDQGAPNAGGSQAWRVGGTAGEQLALDATVATLATQTTLAAVLAQLADPASQTTLAAVLARQADGTQLAAPPLRTQVVHTQLAASHVLKAGAGTLYSASVYIDPGLGAGDFWLLPLDQVSAVDGERNLLLAPIPVQAGDYVTVPCGSGAAASTGIALALSSGIDPSADGPPATATLALTGLYLRLTSAEVGA